MIKTFIAADFGGGSGRIISGRIIQENNSKKLYLKEIHRFSNRVVSIGKFLYWDFPALFAEMKEGLKKAALQETNIVSIGIDTWGVDFGFVDKQGNLISNPLCYRDSHTANLPQKFESLFDVKKLYSVTGTQMLPINTLFQIWGMSLRKDSVLEIADKLLFMPDLFGFFLTGVTGNEYTIASTSELLDATSRTWDFELIESLNINPELFSKIFMPGESRGKILPEVAEETGLPRDTKVVNIASHDTASAVFAAAEPYEKNQTAFLSSGTWSLLGALINTPILSEEARIRNFTNEGGVDNKICFLSNITGLWMLQQLKKEWEQEENPLSWNQLMEEGRKSPFTSVIDVSDSRFASTGSMSRQIAEYCRDHNIAAPSSRGEFVNCVCRSLAVSYSKAIKELNVLLPAPVKRLKIFGGGAQNNLLNELTAETTGLEILTGPIEATAIGNILVQAIADGVIKDKNEITEVIEL